MRQVEDWISSYLAFTENSEPPTLFHEWCAVSLIASALQRKNWLEWGSNTYYPNLYVVLVAPAGKARKGTAMNFSRHFLESLSLPMASEAITREALIRAIKEGETVTPMNGDLPPLVHSSITVFSPELTVFLGYNNVQLMSDLTDWFDCHNKWCYRTKNSGEDDISGIWLNLLGATTPDLIRTALPNDAVGGGLTSRMIFVYADKKEKLVPFPFFSKAQSELREKLKRDLGAIHARRGPFKANAEFIDHYGSWYCAQENYNPFPPAVARSFAGYIERRPTQVFKLSMIMCASRTDNGILEKLDIERAIDLLERTEKKMHLVFSGVGESDSASIVHRVLLSVASEKKTSSQILSENLYDIQGETLNKVLRDLVKAGYLETSLDGSKTFYQLGQLATKI